MPAPMNALATMRVTVMPIGVCALFIAPEMLEQGLAVC